VFRQDALKKGLVSAVRVVALVLSQTESLFADENAKKEIDASSHKEGEQHLCADGQECAAPAGIDGLGLADGELDEQRKDNDFDQVVQNDHVSEQVPESAFDVELVHQDKGHGGRGGNADGANQEGFKQGLAGDKVEGAGDDGPCQQALDNADDKGGLSDFFHPCDVQFLADAEGDQAEEDEYEKMESVNGVVVGEVSFGQDVKQVKRIGTDHGSAEQLPRNLGKPKSGTEFSAEVCG